MKSFSAMLLSSVLALAVAPMAASDPPRRPPPSHDRHGPDLHGRDFYRFSPNERDRWRRGDWRHEWHNGRYAWWWVADGFWYMFAEPVYPYPTYVPPIVIEQAPPPMPQGLPPAQSWYYCDSPQGYYPYVASCAVPWREVPATPPPASAPPPRGG